MTDQFNNNQQEEVRRWEAETPGPRPVAPSPYQQSAPAPKKSNKTWLIVLIVAVILCCCFSIFASLIASYMFGENGQWQMNFSALPALVAML